MAINIKEEISKKIKNKEKEIKNIDKLYAYYNDIIDKLNVYITVFESQNNYILSRSPELTELDKIIKNIKTLTKTESFDTIKDMPKYLKENVEQNNWLKFNSLYNSAIKILKNPLLKDAYNSYAELNNSIAEDKLFAVSCVEQLQVFHSMRIEKLKELDKLKQEYVKIVEIRTAIKEKRPIEINM